MLFRANVGIMKMKNIVKFQVICFGSALNASQSINQALKNYIVGFFLTKEQISALIINIFNQLLCSFNDVLLGFLNIVQKFL